MSHLATKWFTCHGDTAVFHATLSPWPLFRWCDYALAKLWWHCRWWIRIINENFASHTSQTPNDTHAIRYCVIHSSHPRFFLAPSLLFVYISVGIRSTYISSHIPQMHTQCRCILRWLLQSYVISKCKWMFWVSHSFSWYNYVGKLNENVFIFRQRMLRHISQQFSGITVFTLISTWMPTKSLFTKREW